MVKSQESKVKSRAYLVPTLCVGTQDPAAPRPCPSANDAERRNIPFPRGAWERGQFRRRSSLLAARSSRRGVLLIVVLSMLVLFMLIGTAFIMTSSQSRESAKASAKLNRLGTPATNLLEGALMKVLRDTEDTSSTVISHSLLRDLYGTDGFQGVVREGMWARQIPGDVTPLGATQGQFIDLYVIQQGAQLPTDNTGTPTIDESKTNLNASHIIKLDRDALGRPQLHSMPLTRGYYNGSLLTIMSGPAAKQSARIVDYEFVGDQQAIRNLFPPNQNNSPTVFPTINPVANPAWLSIWRFRVMAFSREDGGTLTPDTTSYVFPTLPDLRGVSLIVNGRPFNGTGVGYNPLAVSGQARLTALEIYPLNGGAEAAGAELALLPNARYYNPLQTLTGAPGVPMPNPFDFGIPATAFAKLNSTGSVPPIAPTAAAAFFRYPTFTGPGDADESYDAADFQNMWLALMTVTPRAQGRVVHAGTPPVYYDPNEPQVLTNAGDFLRLDLEDLPLPSFHRPDLVNFWYHRLLALLVASGLDPDEAVRAILNPYDADGLPQYGLSDEQAYLVTAIKRKIMMRPIREDHPNFDGSNPQSLPVNLARVSPLAEPSTFNIMIPYWEAVGPWDVDNDNDGVPDSNWIDLGDPAIHLEDGTRVKALYAYLIIDLDSRLNVNAHGLVDHIIPSPLAVVYDSTGAAIPSLNPPNLAGSTPTVPVSSNILAQGLGYGPAEISLRPVFPAPVLNPASLNRSETTGNPPQEIDSFATLLVGRTNLDGTAVPGKYGYASPLMVADEDVSPGLNYKYFPVPPGTNVTGEQAVPDLAAQLKFFDHPWSMLQRSAFGTPPDLFGRYALGLTYSGQPFYEALYDSNAKNNGLPRALLTNTPYELNLNSSQRRDSWDSQSDVRFFDAPAEFQASLNQNDDAPFSTADMERVLRAWDLEAGSVPSRLWDVVDAFDPLKLMEFDANRISTTATNIFGANTEPEFLAAAQLTAGVNRRLVTTDSYDLPVPGGSIPNQGEFAKGPDGGAGRVNVNDDRANLADDVLELNTPFTDDFLLLFGKDVTQATIFDLQRFYTWRDARRQHMLINDITEAELQTMPLTPDYDNFRAAVSQRAEFMLSGDKFTDSGDGIIQANELVDVNGNTLYEPILSTLLAPEVIAGKRMDLNRPFGDGRDNGGDGIDDDGDGAIDEDDGSESLIDTNFVVDDPMEAGDPFLDVNGNGKWDLDVGASGEPFINLDGSVDGAGEATYSPPRDQLWQGLTTEPIAFDYTNGQAEQLHAAQSAAVQTALNNRPVIGGVRNLSSHGRQLYARHLYCLMLLLMDEKYIAPWDENDPQIKEYLNTSGATTLHAQIKAELETLKTGGFLLDPMIDTTQEARRILLRKLTCRAVAQWAINCADARDADAIMTPFEYDENPWDGWGCMDNHATPAQRTLIPLDGDPGTDENLGDIINWAAIIPPAADKVVIKVANPPTALNRTRGLVWGAERPDLLMTETFATHDRRTEDLASDFTNEQLEAGNPLRDDDLDQRLRPKGSLFVEIHNAWSQAGQDPGPAELYSKLERPGDGTNPGPAVVTPSQGIELGRLSTFGVTSTGLLSRTIYPVTVHKPRVRRSPVFRLIVVEEHPKYRNLDVVDDAAVDPTINPTPVHAADPPARYRNREAFDQGFFEGANPDWLSFDPQLIKSNEPYVERSIYFTTDNSDRWNRGEAMLSGDGHNSRSLVVRNPDDKLVIPPEVAQKSARYFIAGDARRVYDTIGGNEDIDVPIAPVKPGRYALIGTAGGQYKNVGQTNAIVGEVQGVDATGGSLRINDVPRYISTVSRRYRGDATQTLDDLHVGGILTTRRIELLPSINTEVQQVYISGNGGTPLFPLPGPSPAAPNVDPVQRDNELIKLPIARNGGRRFFNIFDGDNDNDTSNGYTPDDKPDTIFIPPTVAVPVANMSVSEPLDLYKERRDFLLNEERNRVQVPGAQPYSQRDHYWDPLAALGEGQYTQTDTGGGSESPYDTPLDTAPELVRNGTTRNYRTIHLQRLADPTLPWNPLPTLPNGTANPKHNPKLPVNLYRTIDTASTDLTSFNGASRREIDMDNAVVRRDAKYLPRLAQTELEFRNTYGFNGRSTTEKHRLSFRSLERGLHVKARTTASTDGLELAPRLLWRQEPVTEFDPADDRNDAKTNTMLEWKLLTTPAEREPWLRKRFNDLRIRDVGNVTSVKGEVLLDIEAIGSEDVDDDYDNGAFPDSLKPKEAHFDIVMEHSLGFQNEAFGAITVGSVDANLPASARGTPEKDKEFAQSTVTPTTLPPNANNPEIESTYPWFAWNNRPFVSAEELLNVPSASSAQMLRNYSTITTKSLNPYDGTGIAFNNPNDPLDDVVFTVGARLAASLSPFGHLLGAFQSAGKPAGIYRHPVTDVIELDANNNWQFVGAPHFYRILDFVHVPSRYVGTETMLTAEYFNDVSPAVAGAVTEIDPSILNPLDPRYGFQPPFNRVSRERDPGQVNLNTVTGRRVVVGAIPRIWSEVFDGIMHRDHDGNQSGQLSHLGPAFRDVVLSRRGYRQFNADGFGPLEKSGIAANPDVFQFGLNPFFPTIFSNPFRSPNAGDLVPLQGMLQAGVQASWTRNHPFAPGLNGAWGEARQTPDVVGSDDDEQRALTDPSRIVDDAREAGFGDDVLVDSNQSFIPLFAERATAPSVDGNRNPYFYYQPMTRMSNLVTNRSNVFAIWITVGYFEVSPAPNWNDPDMAVQNALRARFGVTPASTAAETAAGLALYNRVYPDGNQLGREVGIDTGDIKRPRGFYIVDRTEEVGFKPGEDLNVEKMIRLRRRIE